MYVYKRKTVPAPGLSFSQAAIPSQKIMPDLKMSGDIEKLAAKLDFITESRKIDEEKFSRLNEEIGELRSMLIDNERKINDLDIKASKAADLVSEVQPEKLMEGVEKEKAKIDALKAKMESNEMIANKIIEEFKGIKNKMAIFKGVEEIIELNKDVREEIETIRKIESNVEKHANKVENVFINVEKRFTEFQKLKERIKEIDKNVSNVLNEFNELKNQLIK